MLTATEEPLVFLDIDGTLLTPDQRVPESARQACAAAIARGARLFLCTGRSLPEIYPWLWDLGFEGIVGSGGCYVRIGDRVVRDHRVPQQVVDDTCSWLTSAGSPWVWQSADGMWASTGFMEAFLGPSSRTSPRAPSRAEGSPAVSNPAGGAVGEWSAYARQVMPHLHLGVPGPASKCTFILPQGSSTRVDQVATHFRGRFHVIPGSLSMRGGAHGELVPAGISKGTGLLAVAAELGVPVSRTVAVGDSDNDLEMLRAAGIGIAMGNATDSVKAVADRSTAPVDRDGLALALRSLGLS